jgi:hypothetical protein
MLGGQIVGHAPGVGQAAAHVAVAVADNARRVASRHTPRRSAHAMS